MGVEKCALFTIRALANQVLAGGEGPAAEGENTSRSCDYHGLDNSNLLYYRSDFCPVPDSAH